MHSGTYTVKVGHYTNRTGYVEKPEEFQVHYNGDYSGDVWFTDVAPERVDLDRGLGAVVKLPYDLLEQIVMDKLKKELEAKVKNMDMDTFKKFLQRIF